MNSAEARLDWWWNGPLFCAEFWGGRFTDWWLALTGWSRLRTWNVGSLTGDCNLPGYTGSSEGWNTVFPPCSVSDPVYVTYDPVQVFGSSDGYLYGYGHTGAWGCVSYLLLSPRSELVRTQN